MAPMLLRSQELPGGRARLWAYQDGRYLFELLSPTGKGISLNLPTLREALSYWRRNGGAPEPDLVTQDGAGAAPTKDASA